MSSSLNGSPILLKYLKAYNENPGSKVFAPLAETYRKMGLPDKALEVLKEGIRKHPHYLPGVVGLANCYFDQARYELAYKTLRPYLEKNMDNFILYRIFADSCEALGLYDEALKAYKYLLFLNPKDKKSQEKVKALDTHEKTFKEQIVQVETRESALVVPIDGWVRLGLETQDAEDSGPHPKVEDQWVVTDRLTEVKEAVVEEHPEVALEEADQSAGLDLTQVRLQLKEALSTQSSNVSIKSSEKLKGSEDESPVITHTLVDLYCSQNLHQKAADILEKILKLNPEDKKTRVRYEQIKNKMNAGPVQEAPVEQNFQLKELNLSRSAQTAEVTQTFVSSELPKLERYFQEFLLILRQRSQTASQM